MSKSRSGYFSFRHFLKYQEKSSDKNINNVRVIKISYMSSSEQPVTDSEE